MEGFVHQLWHMTGFQLFWVNRHGCQMWDRKCSLFPEHLISLPLGSSWFNPFIIYVIHNLSDYIYGLMTGLFAWIDLDQLTALSWTYFIITIKDENCLLTNWYLIDSASTSSIGLDHVIQYLLGIYNNDINPGFPTWETQCCSQLLGSHEITDRHTVSYLRQG